MAYSADESQAPHVRAALRGVGVAYHGAIDFNELSAHGVAADEVLDFSVNSNPFGPVQGVRDAVAAAPLERYPDRACLALRAVLAQQLSVSMEHILIGNGATELLWLVAFALLQPGDQVLVVGPTFGEYERNARLMGAAVVHWKARAEDGFAVDAAGVGHLLARQQPRLVHLCNPNNPTGQIIPLPTIRAWLAAYPSTLFLVDEAYGAFAPEMASCLQLEAPNLLVLRSMTKEYALAGVRLGYIVGPPRLVAGRAAVAVPWSVNTLAQAAGVAALSAQADYDEMLARLRGAATHFRSALRVRGWIPVPSATHFFLLPVARATLFREALLRRKILVRRCDSFGLPGYVRIAARTPGENQRFLAALDEVEEEIRKMVEGEQITVKEEAGQ